LPSILSMTASLKTSSARAVNWYNYRYWITIFWMQRNDELRNANEQLQSPFHFLGLSGDMNPLCFWRCIA
jgi:hypothetical protein